MFRSRYVRVFVMISFLFSLIFSAALQAQNPSSDELLKMIPAKTIFCIRINNFNNSLNQIDQFLAGASPMPMGVSMLIRAQFMELLGSPQLNGVNMNGSFAIFGAVRPSQTTQGSSVSGLFVGMLVPVSNYKQFIEGNPNCTQPDEKGVSRISKNGTPMMLATQSQSYALLSWANDYDKLVATAKEISTNSSTGLVGTLDDAKKKQAITEPIWAYSNIQQVSTTFGPLVMAKINEIKETMKNLEASPAGGATPANMQNIMDMYAGIIDTLLKETKSLSISINPKPNVLNITKTISAVPGTDMAKMFVADASSQKENPLLTYLEDGAMMNYGCNMSTSFMKQLQVESIDLFAAMGGDSVEKENVTKMKALVNDILVCLEGPVGYSVSIDLNSKPPFVVKYAVAVKDEKKFDTLIKDAAEMMVNSGIMDFYKSFGMDTSFTIKQGVDSYKGVSIDSAKLEMKSTDAGTPQAQMINTMYGEGFDYRWSLDKGLFVCAVGGDVDSKIRELIDQVQADSPKQIGSEMKSALALLPETNKADFLVTFNLLRVLKMVTAMVPIPIPQMNVTTKSNIVIAGKADDGKLVVDIAVPKEHLTEIVGAFMMMQQQNMMQQN